MDDMQLNRALAERLGYTIKHSYDDVWYIFQHGNFEGMVAYGDNEDAAWVDAFEDKIDFGSMMPRWSQDEGAALRLIGEITLRPEGLGAPKWYLTLGWFSDGVMARLYEPRIELPEYQASAPTAARALAELALRALESDGGNDGTP